MQRQVSARRLQRPEVGSRRLAGVAWQLGCLQRWSARQAGRQASIALRLCFPRPRRLITFFRWLLHSGAAPHVQRLEVRGALRGAPCCCNWGASIPSQSGWPCGWGGGAHARCRPARPSRSPVPPSPAQTLPPLASSQLGLMRARYATNWEDLGQGAVHDFWDALAAGLEALAQVRGRGGRPAGSSHADRGAGQPPTSSASTPLLPSMQGGALRELALRQDVVMLHLRHESLAPLARVLRRLHVDLLAQDEWYERPLRVDVRLQAFTALEDLRLAAFSLILNTNPAARLPPSLTALALGREADAPLPTDVPPLQLPQLVRRGKRSELCVCDLLLGTSCPAAALPASPLLPPSTHSAARAAHAPAPPGPARLLPLF